MNYRKLIHAVLGLALSLSIAACENGKDPQITTPATGGGGPVTKTCADYSTQAQAQAALSAGIHGLDGDSDGVACEHLP